MSWCHIPRYKLWGSAVRLSRSWRPSPAKKDGPDEFEGLREGTKRAAPKLWCRPAKALRFLGQTTDGHGQVGSGCLRRVVNYQSLSQDPAMRRERAGFPERAWSQEDQNHGGSAGKYLQTLFSLYNIIGTICAPQGYEFGCVCLFAYIRQVYRLCLKIFLDN